jgi:hypothetical protein
MPASTAIIPPWFARGDRQMDLPAARLAIR